MRYTCKTIIGRKNYVNLVDVFLLNASKLFRHHTSYRRKNLHISMSSRTIILVLIFFITCTSLKSGIACMHTSNNFTLSYYVLQWYFCSGMYCMHIFDNFTLWYILQCYAGMIRQQIEWNSSDCYDVTISSMISYFFPRNQKDKVLELIKRINYYCHIFQTLYMIYDNSSLI